MYYTNQCRIHYFLSVGLNCQSHFGIMVNWTRTKETAIFTVNSPNRLKSWIFLFEILFSAWVEKKNLLFSLFTDVFYIYLPIHYHVHVTILLMDQFWLCYKLIIGLRKRKNYFYIYYCVGLKWKTVDGRNKNNIIISIKKGTLSSSYVYTYIFKEMRFNMNFMLIIFCIFFFTKNYKEKIF